jgi:nucleoid DNA-binding protein
VNKQDLVSAVAKAADMTKEKAAEAVDAVFDSITAGLKQDGEVRLMGFGTFAAAKRAASTGRTCSIMASSVAYLFRNAGFVASLPIGPSAAPAFTNAGAIAATLSLLFIVCSFLMSLVCR